MKKIIAIGSGKGGVGKSTVAVNLAVALANHHPSKPKVALVDIDFYGPSVPTLMGGGKLSLDAEQKFIPAQRYGVKYISIQFFLKNPDDPVVWRGPMFGKAINQLFSDVSWGDVDICIVDMPPGTGDAQLSLAQLVRLDGAVMVTTPQEVALSDVRRAVHMLEKVNVPVLGVIENMAGFRLPGGNIEYIFGKDGGQNLAKNNGLKFFGSIPIETAIREGGDKGEPAALESSSFFNQVAAEVYQSTLDSAAANKELKIVN